MKIALTRRAQTKALGAVRRLISGATIVLVVVVLAPLATAQNLAGTVKNGTTGKPAAGDDVIAKLGNPESEAGSAWPALIAIKLNVVVTVVPETVYTVAIA